jgi:hypothetical protein
MKSDGVSTPLDPVTSDLRSRDIEDGAGTDIGLYFAG